jgi:hypothetical protein
MLNYQYTVILKTRELHCEREYFVKERGNNFRTYQLHTYIYIYIFSLYYQLQERGGAPGNISLRKRVPAARQFGKHWNNELRRRTK